MPAFGFSNEAEAKKKEEGGLLANVGSAVEFLRPDKLLPAFVGAGLQQARAIPTMASAAAAGGDIEKIEAAGNSPLGFLVDVENVKKQQELANRNEGATGIADKFNAVLGGISPVAQNLQLGFAETGLRGGAAVGSGITQTGLAGPKLSPNEAAELIGVPSYGQAASKGQAGAMLLGDVLNVAPGLKGAGAATKANPLAGTAAGSKIAQAGAALEMAPIAPYALPARGIYKGIQRGVVDATAFPRLAQIAEKEIPVLSAAAAIPESAAQAVGDKWAGAATRAEGLKQQGIINRSPEYAPEIAKYEELIKETPAGPLLDEYTAGYQDLINRAKAEARTEAQYNIVRWADKQAKELGVAPEKLNPTTALGRIVEEVDGELNAVPAGSTSEAFQAPGTPGQLSFEGIDPASAGAVSDLYPRNIREGLKASEKVDTQTAVRNIPANFTDDLIESHMRGLDAPALPKGLGGKAIQGYDTMMKAWKDQVLALRPAWHTTNLVGNTMGALLMGEVSPIWFSKNAKRIMEESQKPRELTGQAMGRGIGAEVIAEAAGQAPKGGKLRQGYRKATEKSYKVNQGVDDFAHTAVALSKFDELVAQGMPVTEARQAAEAFSLRTMGDFGNMSAGERAVIRRISPFYPWYKHQAKATFRFPMENPGRFAQSQAFANRLTPGQERPEGAEFLGRFTPMGGGQFLSVGGDIGVGDPSGSPILNPKMMLSGLTPPAQAVMAAAGYDPRKGGALQAAPGQSWLSGAAGYALNQSATSKLGADVVDQLKGEGGLVRGSTRAPIVSGGRPIADSKRGGPLLPFLTGVSVQEPDLAGAKKRSRKAEKTEATKAKNYRKAAKKRPKS